MKLLWLPDLAPQAKGFPEILTRCRDAASTTSSVITFMKDHLDTAQELLRGKGLRYVNSLGLIFGVGPIQLAEIMR